MTYQTIFKTSNTVTETKKGLERFPGPLAAITNGSGMFQIWKGKTVRRLKSCLHPSVLLWEAAVDLSTLKTQKHIHTHTNTLLHPLVSYSSAASVCPLCF